MERERERRSHPGSAPAACSSRGRGILGRATGGAGSGGEADSRPGAHARAAERAHRDPAGITLLAVTKVFPAEAIREAYALGLRDFGENYVQEFEAKAPEVRDFAGARFHLIGHLQSNKSASAAELFQVIQTVDSAKLARRLNEAGRNAGRDARGEAFRRGGQERGRSRPRCRN